MLVVSLITTLPSTKSTLEESISGRLISISGLGAVVVSGAAGVTVGAVGILALGNS